MKKLIVKIKRQRTPQSTPYFESFKVPYQPHMTVAHVLEWIARQPVNIDGRAVGQVAWVANASSHSGQSVMLVDSKPQDIRSFTLDSKSTTLTLEPLPHRTVLRDLIMAPAKPREFDESGFFQFNTSYWGCYQCGACDQSANDQMASFFKKEAAKQKAFQVFLKTNFNDLCPKNLPLQDYYSQIRKQSLKDSLSLFLT